MRLRPPRRARLVDPSQVIPDSTQFFNFLRDHVKNAGPGILCNPFALRTVYRIAHPNHVGYSCWHNTIPDSGTPPPGMRFTVQQILDAAFPCMKNSGPKLCHQADSVMADGHKRKRISKRFDSKDLCTLVIEEIRTHKRRHSEAESEPSFESACTEMEAVARERWPDMPGNPIRLFSKVPKGAVHDIWAEDHRCYGPEVRWS